MGARILHCDHVLASYLLGQLFISTQALSIISAAIFILNNWLADGLLVGSFFDIVSTRPGV